MRFNPKIKGVEVDVVVEAFVCDDCGSPLMNSAMMNELRKAAADQYRIDRGLLTSAQIRSYREAIGMSQAGFARYLNVGEASIKRWETYYVQDASQDEHIRLKCDEAYAEVNFLKVHWKTNTPDIFSGNKKFNFQIFKNVTLYLISKAKEKLTILFLNKLLYYVDNLHYQRTGESLTGARYVPLKYGPCPDQFRALYDSIEQAGAIAQVSRNGYKAKISPDATLFDDRELETLDLVMKVCQKKGSKYLYNLSHKEKGFIETKECDFISYKFAKDLQLKND